MSGTIRKLILVVIGAAAGFAGWLFLIISATPLNSVFPNRHEHIDFSKGVTVLWLVETIGLIAGAVYLLRTKPDRLYDGDTRLIWISAVFIMLGGMLVCDVFGLSFWTA